MPPLGWPNDISTSDQLGRSEIPSVGALPRGHICINLRRTRGGPSKIVGPPLASPMAAATLELPAAVEAPRGSTIPEIMKEHA